MIHHFQLGNGIKAILEPVEHTGVVSIGIWQTQGSRDEEESESGFSHLLEHMLFKGTQIRSAYQIAQSIERVGGYLNAFTEKETTCFYCTIPREHLFLAIDVLADMILNSNLDAGELEKEKAVIVNEINAIEDNPEEKGYEFYLQHLWNGHSLSRRITGSCEQVQRIKTEDLRGFYQERFVPGNLAVTASGCLSPDAVIDQLNKKLNSSHGLSDERQRIPPARNYSWELIRDRFEQAHIFTGTTYQPSKSIKDFYQDLIFSTLFGESMSSRLFQRMRENEGLCYAVYSYRSYYTDAAGWSIYANTAPETVNRVLEVLNDELKKIQNEPPGYQEIEDTMGQIRGNMILAREDVESRMKRIMRQYLLIGQVLDYEESLAILESISSEDINMVIDRLIRKNRFNLLAYGSRKISDLKFQGFDL